MMSFDTATSYTTVTSDLCTNCETKAYMQGKSENKKDLDKRWQLNFDQGGQSVNLKVMTFTDTVCLNQDEDDSMCMGEF